jgi:uncharacterized membrane protein
VSARADFLTTLRAGLRGASAISVDEILADYTAHFAEGAAANRSEVEVAAALGDPLALADELRMELSIKAFESAPSPRSGARVVAGTIAIGAFNTVLLCIAGPLIALLGLSMVTAILVAAAAGVWIVFAGESLGLPGGIGVPVLAGFGLISAAVSMAAFLALASRAAISGVVRYVRHRYRSLPRLTSPGSQT